MATKIKDSATAEKAAMNLDSGIAVPTTGEPTTPREKTTSERLFPAFTTDDGAIINRPVRPTELSGPLPVVVTPDSKSQGQTPATQPPTVPVYISEADLKGKMAKLKVDGVEQDVPAESLIKTNQLERHLNAQLMNLAQEKKAMEDERRRWMSQPPVVQEPPKVTKQEPPVKKTPEVEALEVRLAQMEQAMAQERALLMPQIQEAGIKRVEKMVKDRIGTEDFRSYFEKIRDQALAESAKPEVSTNPQARAYFDSDAYYFQAYQEMKLKELTAKPSTPAPNPSAPVLVTPEGAPVVMTNNGQPVSMPSFESSGGVPSRVSPDASWQSTYDALFQRAQAENTPDNWMAVFRHKLRADQ